MVNGYVTNYYALTGPTVSADGSLVAFTANRDCGSNLLSQSFYCPHMVNWQGLVQTSAGGSVVEFDGVLRLSRNGRYALTAENFAGDEIDFVYALAAPGYSVSNFELLLSWIYERHAADSRR